MYAVVVRVKIDDLEAALDSLKTEVVPRASGLPGFVAGYWTRSEDGNDGLAMIVFDSEEVAHGASQAIRVQADHSEGVTLNDLEVREVVEHASSGP
jgi:hypothetical protein